MRGLGGGAESWLEGRNVTHLINPGAGEVGRRAIRSEKGNHPRQHF